MDPLKVIMRALYAPHEDYMGMARSMGCPISTLEAPVPGPHGLYQDFARYV